MCENLKREIMSHKVKLSEVLMVSKIHVGDVYRAMVALVKEVMLQCAKEGDRRPSVPLYLTMYALQATNITAHTSRWALHKLYSINISVKEKHQYLRLYWFFP